MGLKPTLDIGERFRFGMHVVYMSHDEPNYVRLQQHAEKPKRSQSIRRTGTRSDTVDTPSTVGQRE